MQNSLYCDAYLFIGIRCCGIVIPRQKYKLEDIKEEKQMWIYSGGSQRKQRNSKVV